MFKELKPRAIKEIPSRITKGKVYECFSYNVTADGIKLLIADDQKKYILMPAEHFEHYDESKEEGQAKKIIKKSEGDVGKKSVDNS